MKNKLETGGYYETPLSLEPPLVYSTYVYFYYRIFYRMYRQSVGFRSTLFIRAAARGHVSSYPPDTDRGDHPHIHHLQLYDLLCNISRRHTDRLGRKSARADQLSGSFAELWRCRCHNRGCSSRLYRGLGHIDFMPQRHTLGDGPRTVRSSA